MTDKTHIVRSNGRITITENDADRVVDREDTGPDAFLKDVKHYFQKGNELTIDVHHHVEGTPEQTVVFDA